MLELTLFRYGQKWSWKIFDDMVRQSTGLDSDVRQHPYVFHNDSPFDRAWCRQYSGDRDVYSIVPGKKRYNFRCVLIKLCKKLFG